MAAARSDLSAASTIFYAAAIAGAIYGLGFLLLPHVIFNLSQDPGVPANAGWVRWAGGFVVGAAVVSMGSAHRSLCRTTLAPLETLDKSNHQGGNASARRAARDLSVRGLVKDFAVHISLPHNALSSRRSDGRSLNHSVVKFIGVFTRKFERVLHPLSGIAADISRPHPRRVFCVVNLMPPLPVLI